MKKHLVILILMISILAACAPQGPATEQPLPTDASYPNDSYPNGSYPSEGLTPAQQAAIAALSKTLGVLPGGITLISTEAVEWPDGCLGVQRVGVMCTQATVPGYKIVLEANGARHEVHTDEDGSSIVLVPNAASAGSLEEMVKKQLAMNLGIEESSISVVSTSDMEFSDSCLGVAMQDVLCAQVVTAGKIIVLEADGVEYTYHVSADGLLIQPATLLMTWKREGGIAGFCDSLTVFLSGEIYANQCKFQPNGTMGTFANHLSQEEREQLDAWIQELGTVKLDETDPEGVSDRMEVVLEFFGQGNSSLSKSDEQAIVLWAQNVFQKLYQ
jgi:hypothetical protein